MKYTVEFLTQEIVKTLSNRENYTTVSLSELLYEAGIDVWDTDFALRYDVRDLIVKEIRKAGYMLDYSKLDNSIGGTPFNEPALIIKIGAVTGAEFRWYSGGLHCIEELSYVNTRISQEEIQIRNYNGHSRLLDGFIFSVDPDQRVELFSLLGKCASEWDSDYSVPVYDGWSWEIRLYSGRKIIRKICGTVEKPPMGDQLEKLIRKIVRKKQLYLF